MAEAYSFFIKREKTILNDILGGVTTGFTFVPEIFVLAFITGMPIQACIASALITLIFSASFGGRPALISGVSFTSCFLLSSVYANHGFAVVGYVVLFAGVLQFMAGIFKLGKFVRLVPRPVYLGFINGVSILLLLNQIRSFQVIDQGSYVWMSWKNVIPSVLFAVVALAITYFVPNRFKRIPGALVALIICTILFQFLPFGDSVQSYVLQTVDTTIPSSLLNFSFPNYTEQIFSIEIAGVILTNGVLIALIGLTESLLSISFIDEVTGTRGSNNHECTAVGASNIVNGLLGGVAGNAMISQSIVNVKSGGKSRLSGIIAFISVLGLVLFAPVTLQYIPQGAVTGVFIAIVAGAFSWSSFRILNKIPRTDRFVLLLVSVLTIYTEYITIAVFTGIVVSSLIFAWNNAIKIRVRPEKVENGLKVYKIEGPLFYASVRTFSKYFTIDEDPETIELDFMESKIWDHSGIDAIFSLSQAYSEQGKSVTLRHLSKDSRLLLKKVHELKNVKFVEGPNDPVYKVVTDMDLEN